MNSSKSKANDELEKNKIRIIPLNERLTEFIGEIKGLANTPYEGGTFLVEITLTENYPFQAPEVKFLTKIWHPNVNSSNGTIGLDILKNEWSAVKSLRILLYSIQSVLSAPEWKRSQDQFVSYQYKKNYDLFERTARHWTNVYAGSLTTIEPEFDKKVNTLVQMGYDEHRSRVALSCNFWNIEEAIQDLFK